MRAEDLQVPDRQIILKGPNPSLRSPGPDDVQPPPAALDIASKLPVLMPAVQHSFTPDFVQVVWPGPQAGLAPQVFRSALRMGDEAEGLISFLLHRPFRARLQGGPQVPITMHQDRAQARCAMADPMLHGQPRLHPGSRADPMPHGRSAPGPTPGSCKGFQDRSHVHGSVTVCGKLVAHQGRSQEQFAMVHSSVRLCICILLRPRFPYHWRVVLLA